MTPNTELTAPVIALVLATEPAWGTGQPALVFAHGEQVGGHPTLTVDDSGGITHAETTAPPHTWPTTRHPTTADHSLTVHWPCSTATQVVADPDTLLDCMARTLQQQGFRASRAVDMATLLLSDLLSYFTSQAVTAYGNTPAEAPPSQPEPVAKAARRLALAAVESGQQ